MIRIGNETYSGTYPSDGNDPVKQLTFDTLNKSQKVYNYSDINALEFELDLRSLIVQSAKELNASQFDFAVFDKSKCNEKYWIRTHEGGFKLRPGQSAYKAIKDILINSRAYATECATAIVIVFYLALTKKFSEKLFNKLFDPIYLMDWKYLDKDLGIQSYRSIRDHLPGDCIYFENPDFNPNTSEWQGENTIKLDENKYYGHGVGIKTSEGIIQSLNRHRSPGSRRSAYISDSVTRPDYRYLYSCMLHS